MFLSKSRKRKPSKSINTFTKTLNSNSSVLDKYITHYFEQAQTVQKLHLQGKYEIIVIHSHEIISNPQDNIRILCNFLGVTPDKGYIEACHKILYSKPTFTRHSVKWTSEQKARVTNEMKKLPYLTPFSFDKN